MCGIAGILSLRKEFNHASLLEQVLATFKHRGPDATGIETLRAEGCLGHHRLAIIDLNARSKLPMWDNTRRYCLSFNGEIYNFKQLRKELQQQGHHFHTESDSEVLIEAWAAWGIKTIERLDGMFAFAIWDQTQQTLFLVRDRLGEKPLYYAPINQDYRNGIIFASELKGLIQYPFVAKTVCQMALSHYLSFNYTATSHCIFKEISKLPAASYLQYNLVPGDNQLKEYWSLASYFQNKSNLSWQDAKDQLDALLGQAVQTRMMTDVPLGAFLSGGVDSAAIVKHMRQDKAQPVYTHSIGFQEKTYNELPFSQQTADHLGVTHRTQIVSTPRADLLAQLSPVFDEPFADTSLIPTYLLSQFAKQNVTVSLSGDGGDELFGGYMTYQADRYHHWLQRLPHGMRKWLYQSSLALPVSYNKISWDYKIKQFLRGSLLDLRQAHISWREVFTLEQKKLLFQHTDEDASELQIRHATLRRFDEVSDAHFLDQAMYVDMKTWLVDDILVKVDRASMAHSLEVRAPFLAHQLVEFAAQLPIGYKIRRRNGKYILKETLRGHLPSNIVFGPKRGFNSPVSSWLLNDWFEMAYETTTNQLTQWFNKQYIESLWYEHQQGLHDHGHRLFNLFCLGLWSKNYN